MRSMVYLFTLILFSGCAGTTSNYYTQTIRGSRGGNAKTLINRGGMQDKQLPAPQGETIYLYKTSSYQTYNAPSPPVGVNFSGTHPVIVPNTNNVWNHGK